MGSPPTGGSHRCSDCGREHVDRFRHDSVGTEHVLLAITQIEIPVAVAKPLGVSLAYVRIDIERVLGLLPKTLTCGEVPFTPPVSSVFAGALDEVATMTRFWEWA